MFLYSQLHFYHCTDFRIHVPQFYRLLAVRYLREDRLLVAIEDFIRKIGTVSVCGILMPVMGPKYLESERREEADTELHIVESVLRDMNATTPIIYLLNSQSGPRSQTGCRSGSQYRSGSKSGSKSGSGSGSDPSNSILKVAKKMRKSIQCIDMGMGMGMGESESEGQV